MKDLLNLLCLMVLGMALSAPVMAEDEDGVMDNTFVVAEEDTTKPMKPAVQPKKTEPAVVENDEAVEKPMMDEAQDVPPPDDSDIEHL